MSAMHKGIVQRLFRRKTMSNSTETSSFVDSTKIGEMAAQQPLSGVGVVMQTGAVNGHGGFAMMPKNDETKPAA